MSKSVIFTTNPRNKPVADDTSALDAFVQGKDVAPTPRSAPVTPRKVRVPMKRFTFDVPADLHKRIRLACVERDKDMAEEIRRILEKNFPVKP